LTWEVWLAGRNGEVVGVEMDHLALPLPGKISLAVWQDGGCLENEMHGVFGAVKSSSVRQQSS
jgi:hypothetical protein